MKSKPVPMRRLEQQYCTKRKLCKRNLKHNSARRLQHNRQLHFETTMQRSNEIPPRSIAPSDVASNSDAMLDFPMDLDLLEVPQPNTGSETTLEELEEYIGGVVFSLSRKERDQVLEDLHGVAPEHPESPAEINKMLQQLDTNLESIKSGSAYELAESMNNSYVSCKDFRLMFLRSQRYDNRDAAKRMIAFFKMKQYLFGDQKLARDITLADLDANEQEYVKSGTIQIVPMFDAAGRQLVVQFPRLRRYKSTESELRARWYLLMTLVKSQETQKRGATVVSWMVGPKEEQQGTGTKLNAIFEFNTLPIHWAALHVCCDDFGSIVAASASVFLMPKKTVAGLRIHRGTDIECLYKLGSFGIPKQAIPLTLANEPQLDQHLSWYNHRQLLESSEMTQINSTINSAMSILVEHPNPSDVLFGPKKKYNNGGNQRLRLLTRRYTEAYDRGHRVMKRQLIECMIHEIRSLGGRFLRQVVEGDDESSWEVAPMEDVNFKIAQMFRNNRRYIVKTAEAPVETNNVFHVPQARDVLFGRRAGNGGNQLVRELVIKLSPHYDSGTRHRKAELANAVFTEVKNTGGRFLVQNTDGKWEEAPDDIARIKISKHFRNLRRYRKSDSS